MYVTYKGMKIELALEVQGEVTNIDGSKALVVAVHPIIPRGPGGPGEPLPLPSAA